MKTLTCPQCRAATEVPDRIMTSRAYVCCKCAFPLDPSSDAADTSTANEGIKPVIILRPREKAVPVAGLPKRRRIAGGLPIAQTAFWAVVGGFVLVIASAAAAIVLVLWFRSGPEPVRPSTKPAVAEKKRKKDDASKKKSKSRDPLTVEELAKQLTDVDPQKRIRAAAALLAIGGKARSTLPHLLNALKDTESEVRRRAEQILEKLGPPRAEDQSYYYFAAKDENRALRRHAAKALASLPSQEGLFVLQMLAGDEDPSIRQAARRSLAKVEQSLLAELRKKLRDPASDVRLSAVKGIGELGKAGQPALANLVDALADKNAAVRLAAADALVALGPETVPVLIETLGDENPNVRLVAIRALGKFGPDARKAIDPLLELGLDASYRPEVLSALARIGSFAIPTIAEKLNSKEDSPRQKLLQDVLLKIGGAALPILQAQLKKDKSPSAAQVVKHIQTHTSKTPAVQTAKLKGVARLVLTQLNGQFAIGDQNQDGQLDKSELAVLARGPGAMPYDHSPNSKKPRQLTVEDYYRYPDYAFLARLDQDSDGRISRVEFDLWAVEYALYQSRLEAAQKEIYEAELKLRQQLLKTYNTRLKAQYNAQLWKYQVAYRALQAQYRHHSHMQWLQRRLITRPLKRRR